MPEVATRTTVPGKPSSDTTRLEPPETTRSGSSASSTSRTASTSSSVVVAVTTREAGPPTRIVVRLDSGTSDCSSTRRTRSGQDGDGLGAAEDLLAACRGRQVDGDAPGVGVDRLDHTGDLDVGAALVGHDDRPGEAHAVLDHAAGVADPVGHDRDGGTHGEHAVGDDVGQPHLLGEPLVPVDRVAVEGGTGVLDEAGPVDVDRQRREGVADGDPVEGPDAGGAARLDAHHSAPRMTMVEVAVQTGSPASVASSVRVVTIEWPPASRTVSTCRVPTTASPAVSGRWWTNRCSPCTTREKSMPASGSRTSCASHCWAMSTAKVGGATTSA